MTAGGQLWDEPHTEAPVACSARLPLVLLSVLLARQAVAQTYAIDQGVWQPGGLLVFSHGRSEPYGGEMTEFGIGPGVGYFAIPGVLVRGSGSFYYRHDSRGHSFSYGVGPGIAYYFRRGPHQLYPYVSGNVSVSWARYYTPGIPDPNQTSRSTSWNVSAGAVRLLTPHFGISGELYYNHSSSTVENLIPIVAETKYTSSNYGLRFGVAFFIY